jgi:anti-sigma factor RsiW
MNGVIHDRARKLLAAAAVEEITANERDWLGRHLEDCPECSSEAAALAAAVQSLRSTPVSISPEIVQRTRLAVRSRAQELHAARARSLPLWIAAAMSSVWMIATTPLMWWTLAWLGRSVNVPDAVWQVAFLMWWFLPATVLAAAAAWRHTVKGEVSDWTAQIDWGQR